MPLSLKNIFYFKRKPFFFLVYFLNPYSVTAFLNSPALNKIGLNANTAKKSDAFALWTFLDAMRCIAEICKFTYTMNYE